MRCWKRAMLLRKLRRRQPATLRASHRKLRRQQPLLPLHRLPCAMGPQSSGLLLNTTQQPLQPRLPRLLRLDPPLLLQQEQSRRLPAAMRECTTLQP